MFADIEVLVVKMFHCQEDNPVTMKALYAVMSLYQAQKLLHFYVKADIGEFAYIILKITSHQQETMQSPHLAAEDKIIPIFRNVAPVIHPELY